LALACAHLRDALAACATFQGWVGAEDAAGAASSIWYDELPEPADDAETYSEAEIDTYWPYAIIYDANYTVTAVASGTERDGASLMVDLCGLTDTSDGDARSAMLRFKDVYGPIAAELAALRETAGYVDLSVVAVEGSPQRAHPDEIAAGGRDELRVTLRVAYGQGGV
jgi:hypothetical protein